MKKLITFISFLVMAVASNAAVLAVRYNTANSYIVEPAIVKIASTTGAQLTLLYDVSNYVTITVSSTGLVSHNAVGTGQGFLFSDTLGVGPSSAVDPSRLVNATGTTSTSASQYGILSAPIHSSAATTSGTGVYSGIRTQAAAFVMVTAAAYEAIAPILGAGSSITSSFGIIIGNQGAAGITNAYGVDIAAQSGAATTNIGLRNAGTTRLTNATASTSTTTGALAITGGVGIGGDLNVGADIISTRTIKPMGYTVATLPAGIVGQHAYVTDATTPTYLGALVGGGAVTCPVFYNGAAWVSH